MTSWSTCRTDYQRSCSKLGDATDETKAPVSHRKTSAPHRPLSHAARQNKTLGTVPLICSPPRLCNMTDTPSSADLTQSFPDVSRRRIVGGAVTLAVAAATSLCKWLSSNSWIYSAGNRKSYRCDSEYSLASLRLWLRCAGYGAETAPATATPLHHANYRFFSSSRRSRSSFPYRL
jgi:hypothetical protein